MAKRFTETEKWRNPSFRKLPERAKLIQLYLWDSCDHAGIWRIDFENLQFEVGAKITIEDLKKWFGEKLYWVGEKHLFLPDFVVFQQKVKTEDELNPKNNAHKSILSTFNMFGVSLSSPGKPLSSPQEGPHEGPSKVEVKVKVKVDDPNFDFDALYYRYPRKNGKSKGMEICRKKITTQLQYDQLKNAIEVYRNEMERSKTEPKFIKHFSTFMNSWEDWAPQTNFKQASALSPQQEEYLKMQEELRGDE